jgi:hypothetical protein
MTSLYVNQGFGDSSQHLLCLSFTSLPPSYSNLPDHFIYDLHFTSQLMHAALPQLWRRYSYKNFFTLFSTEILMSGLFTDRTASISLPACTHGLDCIEFSSYYLKGLISTAGLFVSEVLTPLTRALSILNIPPPFHENRNLWGGR